MKRLLLSLSLLTSGCAAVAHAQVAVVASTVNASQSVTAGTSVSAGTLVSGPLIHWGLNYATSTVPGAWAAWGNAAFNEADFINNNNGSAGGFAWWNTPASGVLPGSPILKLDASGNLTATGTVQGSSVSSDGGNVSAFSGQLFANSFGAFTGNGSYLGYNAGGLGETDFVTQNGGTSGLYYWYFPSSSGVLGPPSMTFSQATGTLTVQTVHAAFTGNLTGNTNGTHTGNVVGNVTGNVSGSSGSSTGNSATATALAATPTPCPTGTYANGVNASGTAQNCSHVWLMGATSSVCTTTSSSPCTGTLNWDSPGFSSTPTRVMCAGASPSGGPQGPYVTSTSSTTVGYQITPGTASQAVASSFGSVTCWGQL
jgi:hypothetical protein